MGAFQTWRGGALVMALALLAAPYSAPTAQAAETLELWRFFNECASKYPPDVTTIDPNNADVCAVQQILANQWNAANPELQVKTTSLLWPGIVELNAALSAGTPPDIVSLHAFRVPAYASKGALTDLTPYLAEAGIDPNDILAKPREAVTYNGKIYAIPIDVHGALWHINLDLWQKAGLSVRMASRCCRAASATSRRPARRSRLRAADRSSARATTMSSAPAGCGPACTLNSAARLSTIRVCPAWTPLRLSRRFRPC